MLNDTSANRPDSVRFSTCSTSGRPSWAPLPGRAGGIFTLRPVINATICEVGVSLAAQPHRDRPPVLQHRDPIPISRISSRRCEI